MTTTTAVAFGLMAKDIDEATRLFIAANMRALKWERRFPSDSAMGKAIGRSRSVINRALKGERTVGLDVLLAVRKELKVSIDWLVSEPRDNKWMDPGYWPKS